MSHKKRKETSQYPMHRSILHSDLGKLLNCSSFTLIDSHEAYELVATLKTVIYKDTIANLSIEKRLNWVGLHYTYVSKKQ